jgi:TetR/AcrR family transcriptional regulator, lmrAB and yxaGH operons repressor
MDRRRTDTRERMIRAALELYRERGMLGTGFSDVLESAGAARGAIYHHFPGGKEELAAAVIVANGRDLREFLGYLLRSRSPGDAIRRFVTWYVERLDQTNMAFGCPIAPTVLEAGLNSDSVANAAAGSFDSWRDLLSGALREQGVQAARARRLAETVVAGIEGALILVRAHRSSKPLRDVGSELARMLDDGIASA